MPIDKFLQRLRAELPQWVEHGWVDARHSETILDHVARQTRRRPRFPYVALSLLGALLFGVGIITFFAANWGGIPKLLKLLMLFAGLGASYAAAALLFKRGFAAAGQGLLLLGVALFGVNIFLIAQIYHIDAHYPNGILLWSLGALATAWLASSQPALIAAIALALLWSATEIFGFDRNPHVWFLPPWVVGLVLVVRARWLIGLRVACWALLGWCLMLALSNDFFDRDWVAGERAALWQIYVFAGIAFYIVARGMSWSPRWSRYAAPVVTAGVVWAVTALFVLSFPEMHRFGVSDDFAPVLSSAWIVVTLGFAALLAALMVWRYHDTELSTLPWYRQGAFIWLVLAGALAVANLVLAGALGGWAALGYNLLAFAGAVWLVMTGIERSERRIVNLGFVFFALLLLARYVDTFWSLLDRSYFFMVGGVVLLVAGFLLERSRRRLTARIDATRSNA